MDGEGWVPSGAAGVVGADRRVNDGIAATGRMTSYLTRPRQRRLRRMTETAG